MLRKPQLYFMHYVKKTKAQAIFYVYKKICILFDLIFYICKTCIKK